MHDQLVKGLNQPQVEAVLYDGGPLLLLAGAGSGKTRVVTHRIARIIADGISPHHIMALTFTNKAANEMKERLSKLLQQNVRGMWVGTFHSLLVRILRRHAEVLGYSRDFRILDKSDQLAVLKQVTEKKGELEASALKKLLASIGSAKNQGKTPDDLRAGWGDQKELAVFYEEYQRLLKMHNGMDFDDILVNAYDLLLNHAEIATYYQNYFQHILVDEYQDTNEVQYQIIAMLAAKHRNLCVVGDDDQSIYGFRGANIANILSFEKHFKDAKVIRLEQNYRSTSCILQAANAVIAENKERKGKNLWTESTFGTKIERIKADNGLQEAKWVADEIVKLTQEHTKSIAYNQIAVLYRINALSRSYEQAFRQRGIPSQIYGGLRFYDRKEIRDVMAYLRLIEFNHDNMAFLRIVNTPRRHIGKATIEQVMILSQQQNLSCFEISKRATEYAAIPRLGAARLRLFADLIDGFAARLSDDRMRLADFVRLVQEETGLKQEQEENRVKDPDAKNRLQNMGELLTDATEFEQRCLEDLELLQNEVANNLSDDLDSAMEIPQTLRQQLSAFVERSALYAEDEDGDNAVAKVKLMTIHSSKGLEFDTVFVVGAEQGIFPSIRKNVKFLAQELEEERRLAYVAMTRAMRQLYISSSAKRMLYGHNENMQESELFRNIPEKCVAETYLPSLGAFTGVCTVSDGSNSGTTTQMKQNSRTRLSNNIYSSWQSRPATTPKASIKSEEREGYNPIKAAKKIIAANKAVTSVDATSPYKKGDKVTHQNLGSGVVINTINIHEDQLLKIDFNGKQHSFVGKNPHLTKEE